MRLVTVLTVAFVCASYWHYCLPDRNSSVLLITHHNVLVTAGVEQKSSSRVAHAAE